MENKETEKKVQLNTKVSANLLKKFKIYCIETDKNINYYIEQMMREKLGKSN
jgi:hypothetical protein